VFVCDVRGNVIGHKEGAAAGLADPCQHPDGLRRMCERETLSDLSWWFKELLQL